MIIIKERAQPHPYTVSDRRTRQLQINAPDDKPIVNHKLVISALDRSSNWFSKIGPYRWLRFCQNWLHHERKSFIIVILGGVPWLGHFSARIAYELGKCDCVTCLCTIHELQGFALDGQGWRPIYDSFREHLFVPLFGNSWMRISLLTHGL